MGHNRLGTLPRNYRWKEVIRLLEADVDLQTLTDASFFAAKTGLRRVPDDPGFLATINAIVQLAAASREHDVTAALESVGIDQSSQTSSLGFVAAISQTLSRELSEVLPRSDVGKIAQDAFLESLSNHINSGSGSLFQEEPADPKQLTSAFRGKQLKSLMHEFYSGFTSRYLSYYLSRELPNHVGPGQRLANMASHSEFNKAFDLLCRQTVRISDEFSPGWMGKAIFEKRTGPEEVKKYAHIAFKKIASEFERGGQ